MSLAKKCDACGTLYEHYNYDVNGISFEYLSSRGMINRTVRTMDLCPSCMDKIKTTIEQLSKGENHE